MGGRAKCLLTVQGLSLLERLVRSVRNLGQLTSAVVLGHHAVEIQAHLAKWPPHLTPRHVINPAPDDDPATSLYLGLQALDDNHGGCQASCRMKVVYQAAFLRVPASLV